MTTREKIPEERSVTIRQEVLRVLEDAELTVGELSKIIGKSEQELYDHLAHLRGAKSLIIIPAQCLACGFIFRNREKVKKPGKCPKCKDTHISQPMFTAARR
ncbi:MAG: ArsR family transcriptional regulator [Desulfobulbaceae bacterium]|nr:ArsR family transcriptional regulator [Desulfobulbaceae bacterium]HIJ78920.1 ArsR family transcriptional regulator [Deltaproteobacteria bacterium]